MQVSYKTITTLEYDIYTGTYKNVEKQVQDTQAGADFAQLMQTQSGANASGEMATQDVAQSTINSALNSIDEAINDLNNIIYGLKFGATSNEMAMDAAQTTQSVANPQTNAQNTPLQNSTLGLDGTQSNDEALKSQLMSDLLNVLN